MEPVVTTSALVLHNLGLAAGFGGSLFGKFSLAPAMGAIEDKQERSRVMDVAWNSYKWVNAASIGSVAITWFAGRRMMSGRVISPGARRLVIAKDVLLVTSLASTTANIFLGRALGNLQPPLDAHGRPAPEASAKAASLQRVVSVLGTVNLICAAGLIGITSWLNNKAASSFRWNLVSRMLP